MIHLDTNYLIGLLVKGSPEALAVDQWLAAGESCRECNSVERISQWARNSS
jgi:hypothetical protein